MRWRKTVSVLGILLLAIGTNIIWDFPGKVYAGTDVNGGDVWGTWNASNSPYYINNNITIPYGETLVIEPGVKVIANGSYQIVVEGKLYANGTWFEEIEFNGNYTPNSEYYWIGIRFNGTGSGTLNYCNIYNATYGVIINNSTGVEIINCYISDNHYGLVIQNHSEKNNISFCTVINNKWGCYLSSCSNNSFLECRFNYNSVGLDILHSSYNQFNVIDVLYNIESGMYFKGESNNNIIFYSEIYSNDNLLGGNNMGLVFDAGPRFNSIIQTSIWDNNVYVWGITNSYNTFNDSSIEKLVLSDTDNVTIKDCSFYNLNDNNINLLSVGDIEILDCVCLSDSYNIYLFDSKNVNITNTSLSRYTDYGNSKGIWIEYCNNITIKSCEVFRIKSNGIYTEDSSDIHIVDCKIYENYQNGMYIENVKHILLLNTTISENHQMGVSIYNSRIFTLQNCSIYDSISNHGLYIDNCKRILINDSEIFDNPKSGIYSIDSSKIQVINSKIKGNVRAGVESSHCDVYLKECKLSNYGYELRMLSYSTAYLVSCQVGLVFDVDSSSKLYLGWYLNISVKNSVGNGVKNAIVKIIGNNNPPNNNTEYLTDNAGRIDRIICYQFLHEREKRINYTPYLLMAQKADVGVAKKTVNITNSLDLTIVLNQIDLKVTKITYSWPDNRVPVDEDFNISVEIENIADSIQNNIELTLNVNSTPFKSDFIKIIPSIQPNGKKIIDFSYAPIRTAGEYEVSATVDSNDQVIEIDEKNNKLTSNLMIAKRPTAKLDANRTSVWVSEPVLFLGNKSYGPAAILEYIFDFNDGTDKISLKTSNQIIHKFGKSGYYTVTLVVIDIHGIPSYPDTIFIEVKTKPGSSSDDEDIPIANFTISPKIGDILTSFTFDPSPSLPSSGAEIQEFTWSFGDGETSKWKKPVNKYDDDGIYTVSLMIKDSKNKESKYFNRTLIVENTKPVVIFTADKLVITVGQPIIFSGDETYDIDDTLSEPGARFTWYFGDKQNSSYTESSIIYPDGKFDKITIFTYIDPGEYIARLEVVDDDQALSYKTLTIEVLPGINQTEKNDTKPKDNNFVIASIIALIIIIIIILIAFLLIFRKRKRRSDQDREPSSVETGQSPAEDLSYSPMDMGSETIASYPDGEEAVKPGGGITPTTSKKVKKAKKKDKIITKAEKTNMFQPPAVEVILPDERVVDWKDEVAANGHVLSLGEVSVVSDQDLIDASMISVDDEEDEEFLAEPFISQPEELELEEPEEIIEPEREVEPIGPEPELEEPVEWVEPGGFEDSEEIEEVDIPEEVEEYEEEFIVEPESEESLVFEFEEDGETITQELEASPEAIPDEHDSGEIRKDKYKTKHQKDKLIPIAGVGFVKRSELQKVLGMDQRIDGDDEHKYKADYPAQTGMPLKVDDYGVKEPDVKCIWCNRPIKGKFIKVRPKDKDGLNLAVVGPFCSPECANNYRK